MTDRELLQKIDDLVQTDFSADMNTRLIRDDAEYTQEEAREMADIIGSVYMYSHRIHCKACANNE